MSASTVREKAAAAIVVTIVLYVAAAAMWFFALTDPQSGWNRSRRAYDAACKTYERQRKLISERARWTEAYDEERARMPMFEAGRDTDTTWMRRVSEAAERCHIVLSSVKVGKETSSGDVKEVSVEVGGWEGALESLVKFMYDLENSGEGMFDIRHLSVAPSQKQGYLKGAFTVTCAYMRE